jgi:threonylcarbamoyladenosine tRNA methylthiotransferase MtaB
MRITNFEGRTRAFVKLQDGCNNFCSYCIIPYVRGRNRNKDFDTAVEEIKTLTENGYKEIVLTGIHTGSYVKLIELINQITLLPKLKRIRISSLEITEINKEFLELLKVNSKVCNHLHIPLQSGSDNVLKQMNRKYSIQYYQEVINKIREASPDINITTDIIVGFPTETETDFNETLKFAKAIGFGKIHVFPYSKRNNTVAATLKSVLDEKEKKERVNRLLSLSDELEQLYYQQFINNQLEVLIEEVGKNYSAGYTSNYVKVVVNKELNQNDEISVIVNKLTKGNVEGKIIE